VNDDAIEKCRRDYTAFLELLKNREQTRLEQQRQLAIYQVRLSGWNRRHEEELRKRDSARTPNQSQQQVHHEGYIYNCMNLPHDKELAALVNSRKGL